MEDRPVIKFENVSKSFGNRRLLEDVSFEVRPNETVAVLGPSGSGKTTFLRLIAGTVAPDSGRVEVASHRIGFIFQDHRLVPWLTAQDNIALPLRAEGRTKDDARRRARSWMDRLGLQGFYSYYPAQMSGGMVQRISIARAFAFEPEIMLMDEPFSSLDTSLADVLLRDLRQVLAGHRVTTVYVTHEFTEAVSVARRVFRFRPPKLEETTITDPATAAREYFLERARRMGIG
jgi:NitT/TauT family transport system ATP-binding protein